MQEQKLNSEVEPNVSAQISMRTEDAEEKERYEQNQELNDEIIAKIYLLLNGLSYRKARYILNLAIARLADKTNLHIDP